MCRDFIHHYYPGNPGFHTNKNHSNLIVGMLNLLGLVGHWDRLCYIPNELTLETQTPNYHVNPHEFTTGSLSHSYI